MSRSPSLLSCPLFSYIKRLGTLDRETWSWHRTNCQKKVPKNLLNAEKPPEKATCWAGNLWWALSCHFHISSTNSTVAEHLKFVYSCYSSRYLSTWALHLPSPAVFFFFYHSTVVMIFSKALGFYADATTAAEFTQIHKQHLLFFLFFFAGVALSSCLRSGDTQDV